MGLHHYAPGCAAAVTCRIGARVQQASVKSASVAGLGTLRSHIQPELCKNIRKHISLSSFVCMSLILITFARQLAVVSMALVAIGLQHYALGCKAEAACRIGPRPQLASVKSASVAGLATLRSQHQQELCRHMDKHLSLYFCLHAYLYSCILSSIRKGAGCCLMVLLAIRCKHYALGCEAALAELAAAL